MLNVCGPLKTLRDDRRGVTAVEYGLIASLMSVVLVAIFSTFGKDLVGAFTRISIILLTPT